MYIMPFKLCERTKFANGRGKFWIASGDRERESGSRKRVREHMANNYNKKDEPIKYMNMHMYACMCLAFSLLILSLFVVVADERSDNDDARER